MSIHTKIDAATELNPLLARPATTCFLCGRPLFGDSELSTDGFVHWQGATGEVSLHQFCAEQLGVNLIQDSRTLAARTGKQVKAASTSIADVSRQQFTIPPTKKN